MAVLGKKSIIFVLLVLYSLLYSPIAFADGLMTAAATKTVMTFNSVKGILFVVGGFGLVGITFAAIFGKLRWKWIAALGFGLAIVAAAAAIVSYSTGDYMDGLSNEQVIDTFGTDGSDLSTGGGGGGRGGGGRGGSSGGRGTSGGSSGGSGSGSSWWQDFVNGFIDGFNGAVGGGGSGGNDFSASDLRINN